MFLLNDLFFLGSAGIIGATAHVCVTARIHCRAISMSVLWLVISMTRHSSKISYFWGTLVLSVLYFITPNKCILRF
jgi:uncharacterized BrkB/YihY/UPF0761 family membrane protein